jgi:hypothetical protein
VVAIVASPSGLSVVEAANLNFEDGQYVWLAAGAPAASDVFGTPLSPAYSYLLQRRSGRFVIAGRWPIGGGVTRPSG